MPDLTEQLAKVVLVATRGVVGDGVVYVKNLTADGGFAQWIPAGMPVDEWPSQFREMLSQAVWDDKERNFIVVYCDATNYNVLAYPRADLYAAHATVSESEADSVDTPTTPVVDECGVATAP